MKRTMLLCWLILTLAAVCRSALDQPSAGASGQPFDRRVSEELFLELEELSRLTAISYCVGSTGIQKPFQCLNRCSDFEHVELVETFHAGQIDLKTCGYVAISHRPGSQRILVAFRGTQSLSDVISDMMTFPAQYLPYSLDDASCNDCRVHGGFMAAWAAARALVLPTIENLVANYPRYELVLAGHSLGGAMAGLAALEFQHRGWNPRVTTFGEPRFGNAALAQYVDAVFPWNVSAVDTRYRRVTHIHDPVPLLPFEEWEWRMHGGEIFISKPSLQPEAEDLERCVGQADPQCIQGNASALAARGLDAGSYSDQKLESDSWLPSIPSRWWAWELFFAHRDYFWRMGFCFDPQWRDYPQPERPCGLESPEL